MGDGEWRNGGVVEFLFHCSQLQRSAPVASNLVSALTGFTLKYPQTVKFGGGARGCVINQRVCND